MLQRVVKTAKNLRTGESEYRQYFVDGTCMDPNLIKNIWINSDQ